MAARRKIRRRIKSKVSRPVKYVSKKLSKVVRPLKDRMPFRSSSTLDDLEKNLGKSVYMHAEYKAPVDRELDEQIRKLARHKVLGTDFGFYDHVRAVTFYMTTKKAFSAAQRIKQGLPKVKVRFVSASEGDL